MSRPLAGLSFSLSGFVNPERGDLRQAGCDLGAKYHPDWTATTTHLICAVAGTPKAVQVQQAKAATHIVAKQWLSACLASGKRENEATFSLASEKNSAKPCDQKTATGARSGIKPNGNAAPAAAGSSSSTARSSAATCSSPLKRPRPAPGEPGKNEARATVTQWVKNETEAFVSFLQDNAAYQSSEMPLGFMARSGLIDSLMFAETTLLSTHSLGDMIDAWAPPLPQALLVVSQDISKGVYGDVGSAAAAAAAADLATMRRMYACILGGDVEACASAPAFMSGFSVYVDPAGQLEEIERVQDELSRRGAHLAAKTDVSLGCNCVVVTRQSSWHKLFRQGCGVSVVDWGWVSE